MNRLIFIILLLFSFQGIAFAQSVDGVSAPASVDGVSNLASVDGVAMAGGVPCTGDWGSKDVNEAFEKGAAQFCTTDWVRVDSDSDISTYDGTYYNSGSYAARIDIDTASPDSTMTATLNADHTTGDIYFRWYGWYGGVTGGDNYEEPTIEDGSDNRVVSVRIVGTNMIKLRSTDGGTTSEYFTYTPNAKYRLELLVHCEASCTTESGASDYAILKMWDSGGSPVETSNGGGDYELTRTNIDDYNVRVWQATDDGEIAQSYSIDDVEASTSGWIGAY